MSPSRRPPALAIFRVVYWAAATILPLGLLLVVPEEHHDLLFSQMTGIYVVFYLTAAAVVYRLMLRFAWHATGSDAVDREIRDSEGRIELNLDVNKRPSDGSNRWRSR